MLAQSERDFQRKFVGNVALFLDIDRYRQRTVLQRNVEAALLHHENSEFLEGDPRSGSMSAVRNACALKNESEALKRIVTSRICQSRKSKWRADAMLAQAASLPEAALKLELKSLKRRNSRSQSALNINGEPPTKRMRGLGVRCHCDVSIFENEKVVVRKSEQCTLQRVESEKERKTEIQIDLDGPIIIRAKELSVDVVHQDTSMITVADSYTLQLSIKAIHSGDLWPLIPVKDGESNVSTLRSATSGKRHHRPAVVSKLPNLLQCPPDGALLDVFIIKDGKKYETEYGMAIDASWNKFESSLEKLNAAVRSSAAARFPTPISEPETPKDLVRTTYLFGELRSAHEPSVSKKLVTMGYLCPLCRNRDFGCLYLLNFHLLACHSLFKFNVKKNEIRRLTGVEVDVTIEADVADQYFERASNHVKDERDFIWVRPDEPFDLSEYLAGDERWVGGSDLRSIAPGSFRTLKTSASTIVSAAAPSTRTPGALDVPDLPPPKRKRHVVPPAPAGIAYFRTTAKRRLVEGEAVSESDDEVDDTWLYHKHDEIIDDFTDITLPEKKFVKRYDEHMLRERLNGNAYLPDALVRFCRANGGWLAKPDMKIEFWKLAAKLRLQGTLDDSVILNCQKLIGESIQRKNIKGAPKEPQGQERLSKSVGPASRSKSENSGASGVPASDKMLPDDKDDMDVDGLPEVETAHGDEPGGDISMGDASLGRLEDLEDVEISSPKPSNSQRDASSTSAIRSDGSCVCGFDIRNMKDSIICAHDVST
ncbi:MAG: hypothetical protein M1836_003013 [Candelina mexicana]|nr:MAG: hypothetical protein M1836_003013 [Candelina mexicana]